MSKSIQMKNINNEKIYVHPYYPIGSIYISVNDTNPSKWFGGTWEQIAKGRTLVGVDTNDTDFNEVKKTGGEKNHTLTKTELPNTTLKIVDPTYGWTVHSAGYNAGAGSDYPGISGLRKTPTDAQKLRTEQLGNNTPHNNLQPYFTCYIWCRTA